jgi:C4-dicarboxylate-specific signal transduction histidine kinase
MSALKEFVKNPEENNEVTLQDHQDNEKIFLINQTQYTENIYKSSGTVTIFTDVTKERKALQEKIKHQEFIVQQSKLAEIGEIFSSIAHQWKSPLVEIATVAQEQLYNCEGKVDEKNNTFVNDIMVQVQYMTDTINEFQEFIMPSSKKIAFNIQDAILRMMHIIQHTIKYNYIKVSINVAPNTNLTVLGYKNELMQTMLNIVNNAKDAIIKAKKIKKIKKGEIDIHIFNHEEKVLVEIEDNAGGINEENLSQIFTPYFTTKESGHGIGLYMAKLIIEDKMGGKISVTNAQKGAKFCIELEVYHENISSRRQ